MSQLCDCRKKVNTICSDYCIRCGEKSHPGWKCEVPADGSDEQFFIDWAKEIEVKLKQSKDWDSFTSVNPTDTTYPDRIYPNYMAKEVFQFPTNVDNVETKYECVGWCGGGWCKCK